MMNMEVFQYGTAELIPWEQHSHHATDCQHMLLLVESMPNGYYIGEYGFIRN